MSFEVKRITNGPKHHLFGFHDLTMTNAKGDFALCLEVDDISHPPLPGETCRSGIIHLDELNKRFESVHLTRTWNYPQGARQQWIGDSDFFVCNDRDDAGNLVARISDARAGKVVKTLPFPVHCLAGRKAFYINYDRVHACGGYGYTPGLTSSRNTQVSNEKIIDIPSDDGLFIGDIDTGEHGVLVTIEQVAACGEMKPVKTGYPHYLTHLMLNPSGTRLCFLHRYRVPDGGETTRLMTVGADGSELRCLAKGFLSHFTWISDDEVLIWGKDERALCKVREASLLRVPGVLQLALIAKNCMRIVRSFMRCVMHPTSNDNNEIKQQNKAFLRIRDEENPEARKTAIGILTEDGHPMACPKNRHWLVNDTYPNAEGDRWLMFYDVDRNERVDVGKFRRLFVEPDSKSFDWRASQRGIDKRILKKFPRMLYLFARSGYHTDLHPRWSQDGRTAFFDSIHEGSRQIYAVEAP